MPKTDQIIEFFSTKENKKDTFFSNPKFWLFEDFLILKVFPEKNLTQKPANLLGPHRKWQNISKCAHRFVFFGQKQSKF